MDAHQIPPPIEDVHKYISDNYGGALNADYFFDYYDAVDWYRGKTKIKNWQACVRTWAITQGLSKKKPVTEAWD